MGKRILSVTILYFFMCMGQGFAFMRNDYYVPNGIDSVAGTIEGGGLNTIDIYDEERKRVERFVYLDQKEQFQKGDHVRIYYHPRGGIVQSIKRMPVLDYKANGQNLGNIFRH